jgi:DNA-binding HxlR family transcriptional regulator
MQRNTHPELTGVDEKYRKTSIETIFTLLELDVTSDSQSVTLERLRLAGLNSGVLRTVLDQLVAAGIVRRITYHLPNQNRPRRLCHLTVLDRYGHPQYRLTDRFETRGDNP